MLHKWRHSLYMFLVLLALADVSLFQNCAKNQTSSNTLSSTEVEGELEIPDEDVIKDDVLPEYIEKAQVSQLTANRILVTNFFVSIFGSGVRNVASSNIAYQEKDFGSAYSVYETVVTTDCNKTKNPLVPCVNHQTDPQTPSNVALNIRREAWRIRTCHYATSSNPLTLKAMKHIMPKATLANPPPITDDNLDKAYQLFFRASPLPSDSLLDSLTIVSQKETDAVKKWQAVLLTLCLSPHWQVL